VARIPRLAAALPLIVVACAAALAADIDERLRKSAAGLGQREPMIRIGLAPVHRVEIGSDGTFRVLDPATGKPLFKPVFSGTLHVVAEGGPTGEVPSVYRVQVAAFSSEQAAEAELKRLVAETGIQGVIRRDPDRGVFRVRMGTGRTRLSLNTLLERLRRAGMSGLWVTEEPAEEIAGVTLRLVDESYDSFASGLNRVAIVPRKGSHLEVDGKPYRGLIELRVSPFGTVRPINWIEIERYLLGVVPAELGPEVWPELEALRSQAVAARTYAWRNLGQFEDEGFDLCATPRCQVYEGMKVEHPLSDRAVHGTRGEVLFHEGKPIIALYTATCGGHTENGGEIFSEHDEPYLTGVPCRAETAALETLRGTVPGWPLPALTDATGAPIARDAAILAAAGVLSITELTRERLSAPLTAEDLRRWTRALATTTGLTAPVGDPGPVDDLGRAAESLLADVGWTGRAEVLLSEEDLPALLRDPAADKLPETRRRAIAYLAWTESLRPFGDGSFQVDRRPARSRLIPSLADIGQTYEAFGLAEGVVSGVGATSLRIVRGKGEIRLPLKRQPFLFGLSGGKPVPVRELPLWPGDRVRYRTDPAGSVDFLELRPPVKGVADDRSSAVYSWTRRKTRRELEVSINQRVAVGKLRDLVIRRRGVSGRVVQLEIVGSKASTVVRGFDVRRVLDLRELLTVIEIQRDPAGEIQAVVFAGKGWGHGVGLCQVGAYGMALRGVGYKEILAHYYRGARLTKMERPPG